MTDLLTRYGLLPDSHQVPDMLAPELDIVFCGTALGFKSASARAYYAHPGNFFWRSLYATGLTPRQLAPHEYPMVLEYRLGLTDLSKTAYGQDAELPAIAFDRATLEAKILHYQPRFLAFTCKTSAAVLLDLPTAKLSYGLHPATIGVTELWVLPSPSGQARKFWSIAPWQQLADAIKLDR